MNRVVQVATCVLALSLILGPMPGAAADAPSGDEVIANFVKASGGVSAYKKLKNRVVKSTLAIAAMGMEAPREEYLAPPNSFVSMASDFGDFLNGTKGDVAWSVNPMAGSSVLEGGQKDGAFRQASLNPFLNWKDQGAKAENKGEEAVGDITCYKVEVTRSEGDPETYYFGKDDGLLHQIDTTQDGTPSTVTLSNYKEVDGVKVAHRTAITGQFDIEITINSIEHNVDIADDRFNFPSEIEDILSPPEPAADTGSASSN